MSCYLDKRVIRHRADVFWTIGRIVSLFRNASKELKAFTYIRNSDGIHDVTQSIIVDFNSFFKIWKFAPRDVLLIRIEHEYTCCNAKRAINNLF